MTDLKALENPVILFDGVCNLCSGTVQFILKRDPRHQFRFASLQNNFGQEVLRQFHLPPDDFNSFILLENGKIYTRSSGALRITKKLPAAWPLLYGLMIIPPFIRNGVYSFVAKNRYKWFGKQDACWLPTPELRKLFFD